MTTSTSPGQQLPLAISTDGERVIMTFHGVLYSSMALALEEHLQDPRLSGSREWLLDMGAVERIDLVCAYALLRVAGAADAPSMRVTHANRRVERTLHHAGLHAVATFDA
ncbi:STAS domain-containing protein [Streptomyces xantholiticus]|uniref:STAS domain-containing protein n=1 Tax=Streptomyces xantholiticus TaxID=68285 RepID=UPI0019B4DF8A|nr:STAS domain-containing protein [Streptomyces xantholiticus]GGW38975.1 hypothetical protein GCM10010381_24520 [Streptomyces xantholiticus]